MSLYRSYGPVNCTIDPDDSTLGGIPDSTNHPDQYWWDDHGWLIADTSVTGAGNSPVFVCNLDGVWILRRNTPSAFAIGDYNYDYLTNKGFTLSGTSVVQFEPELGCFTRGVIKSTTTAPQIRTPEGWYRMSGSANIQRGPLDMADDTEFVTEHTLVNGSPATFGNQSTVSPGPGTTIYFNYSAGAIVQYDYIKKEEVYPNPGQVPNGTTGRLNFGGSVVRAVYSQKLDCFMVLTDSGTVTQTNVYAAHPEDCVPNAISVPVATPAVAAGVLSEISVTLSDDFSVGIPGRLIDWSITAGNGTLTDSQTTTDEDGIATTYYRAPISGGVNPTIQASLTY